MEFGVLIHVLPLVVRILGHCGAPPGGKKTHPFLTKTWGIDYKYGPLFETKSVFSRLKRGQVRGCPAGTGLVIFLMVDSVDFLKGIPNTCVDCSSLAARRVCRL